MDFSNPVAIAIIVILGLLFLNSIGKRSAKEDDSSLQQFWEQKREEEERERQERERREREEYEYYERERKRKDEERRREEEEEEERRRRIYWMYHQLAIGSRAASSLSKREADDLWNDQGNSEED